jgi:tetratricopeptide (TPR) repeat protein
MLGTLASAWDDRDSDVVRTRYEQALSTFEEVGARKDAALARNGLGEIALREGDVETAGEYFEAALEGFEAVGSQHEIGIGHRNLGTVAIEHGEYDAAREHLQQAEQMLEDIGDRYRLTVSYVELARLDAASGDPDRGLERWDDIVAGLAAMPKSERVVPFERLIETCRDEGHDAAAREWRDRLRSHVEAAEEDSFEDFREWLDGSADADTDDVSTSSA